jgi:RNA polymerase sigma-70 factor (ECF subfamily)
MSPSESPEPSKVTPHPSNRWVANLQAGVDVEESFRQLVQEYGAAIERFFLLRRFSPQEAKDLAQDTFINAYLGIHTFRSDASLKTWLLGVAQNVWRNELRRRSAAKRAAVEVPLEDPESGEEQASLLTEADELINALLRKERRRMIVQELRKFPPQMRRCMLLRVLQDLKYREIAAVLRISTQTVKSHLFEARQRLKEVLEEVELHD